MLTELELNNLEIGTKYYSVGPLQGGLIEEWTYTGDIYDNNRILSNNFFFTEEEAIDFHAYMLKYKKEHTPEYAFRTSIYGLH